ncbi:MAG: VRR-NUC domain-containing protein [Cetobacterium sp.]|uniref:VRR-NUC domain-containing protein n=1 Tax=Cetobacterium sp. ZWU0022 TaxID=1340502 RepID=UPI0006481866|nr:VRR-NUC domain-containing protein [Cetobacterium sp. ZWU0022]
MKEIEIQSSIIQYLQILENQNKIFFQRINNIPVYDSKHKKYRSMVKGGKKGFPDILILTAGKIIGLEVKSETGKQSKEQKEIEKKFKQHGQEYFVVRSLQEVIAILSEGSEYI